MASDLSGRLSTLQFGPFTPIWATQMLERDIGEYLSVTLRMLNELISEGFCSVVDNFVQVQLVRCACVELVEFLHVVVGTPPYRLEQI